MTELFAVGAGDFIKKLLAIPEAQDNVALYLNRLNDLEGIKNIDLHMDEVTGEDKTVDVVVDIFNKVNSGGTKLSKGDLALAKICAQWPDAREEIEHSLGEMAACRVQLQARLASAMYQRHRHRKRAFHGTA